MGVNPQVFLQSTLGSAKGSIVGLSAPAQTQGMLEPRLGSGESAGASRLPGEAFGRELSERIGKALTDSRRPRAKLGIDSRSPARVEVKDRFQGAAVSRSGSRLEPAAGLADLEISQANTEREREGDADTSRPEAADQPCGSCNSSSPVNPSSLRGGGDQNRTSQGHTSDPPRATAQQTPDRSVGDQPASPDRAGAGSSPPQGGQPSEDAPTEAGPAGKQAQSVPGENHGGSVETKQEAVALSEASATETVGYGDEESPQEVKLEGQRSGEKPTEPATEAGPLEGELAQVSEVPEGTEVTASTNGDKTETGQESLAGAIDEAAKAGQVTKVSKTVSEAVAKPGGSAPVAAPPAAPDGTSASPTQPADPGQNGLGQQSPSQHAQQGLGGGFQQGSHPDGQAPLVATGLAQVAKRFAEAVEMSRVRNEGEMTLRLETKTLGEMQLKVSIANQVVHASILAEHEAARAMLSSQQGSLHAALARQNLRFEGLSVALGGDGATDEQARQDDGPQEPRRQVDGRSAEAIEYSTSRDSARERTVSLLQGGTLSVLA